MISLICDRTKSGNEGFDEEGFGGRVLRRRDDDDDDNGDNDADGDDGDKSPRYKQDPNNALQFVSYGEVDDGKGRMDVLRLSWRTRYACEEFEGDDDEPSKQAGWGFFTWFILM